MRICVVFKAFAPAHKYTHTRTCTHTAGPCDLGITYGLHVKYGYDVGAMIASPDLAHVYDAVLQV